MAETWRARLLGAAGVTKPVLIKRVLSEFSADQAFTTMFISEARISATLSHGNIAQVYDFGRLDGEYFLAMEFVDGQPLHRIIKRTLRCDMASIPVPLAAFIGLEICRGLHYAHTRTDDSGKPLGIVHRDISPDNVIISYEGQVKIVDFGIAKARELRGFNTEPGVVKGKYLFFSPEQARGQEVDARTDVWATGVVLYEMLCGRLPVEGQQYVALPKLIKGEFPRPRVLNPELPSELESIVMKALAVDRDDRFESSHAFGDALAGFLYSTTPRFSAMSLAHFVQELFRDDLTAEGRPVQVPRSFLEQLAQWQGAPPPTAPLAPPPVKTQPLPPQPRSPPARETAPSRTPPRGLKVPPSSPPSRMTPIVSALAGAAIMGVALVVGLVMMKEPSPVEDPSRPQPFAVGPPPSPSRPPPREQPRATPPPATPPPLEQTRGLAEYPVNNIVIETRRDIIDVSRVTDRLTLEAGATYRISEPAPPVGAPPLFFWLAGTEERAEDSVGALARMPRLVKGSGGLKLFVLAPLPSENARREVVVENLQSGSVDRLILAPPEAVGTERAFELSQLDENASYRLDMIPMPDRAYTRGQQGGPVGKVACVRLSPPGFVPDGVGREAFHREQQFLLLMDTGVTLSGATRLWCGFIDSDVSDNQGAVRIRITPLSAQAQASTTEVRRPAASPPRLTPEAKKQAETAYEDALKLFRARQHRDALILAKKCVELAPNTAQCHKLLGAIYAMLMEVEPAAKHYREFLRLAPTDPSADKVRDILKNYEKQQSW
jgi:serine/threonine-protein kinase